MVLLDEVNVALKHGFLSLDRVLQGLAEKPAGYPCGADRAGAR
jgi:ATP:corrinoid adenosyltransferase